MKRLLLSLVAALALPIAVNAESYWLLMMRSSGMEKIEMKDIQSCNREGKRCKGNKMNRKYICIIGK